jgi:hypothetical protein
VSEQSEHVSRVDFFRPPQKPNGGTVYVRTVSTPVKPSDSEEGSVDSEE